MKYFDKEIKVTEKTHDYRGSFLNNEVHSKELIELVLNELNNYKNPILLDIGACTGSYALLDIINPKIQIHSFEPSRAYNELINNIILNNSKTNCYNLAISDKCGIEDFNEVIDDGCIALSMLSGKPAWHKHTIQKPVEVITIDKFCKNNNIIPSIIKIDTEGNEISVINGAKEIIKNYKPIIIAEYSEENLNQYGYGCYHLEKILTELGYKCEIFNHNDIIAK